jgi:hypothetical protein
MLETLTYESPESLREDVVKGCIIDRASAAWERIRQFKKRAKRAQLSIQECLSSPSIREMPD